MCPRRPAPTGCPLLRAARLQVVNHERPDLQDSAMRLVRELAQYTIQLKELEDNLLARLAASQVGAGRRVGLAAAARGPAALN